MSVADYDLVVIGGTAAAVATSASVRLPIVVRSTLFECQGKQLDRALRHLDGPEGPGQRPHPPFGLPSNPEIGTIHVGSGFIH
jgi:hypothetical protein